MIVEKTYPRLCALMKKTFPGVSVENIQEDLQRHKRRCVALKNGATDWEGIHKRFSNLIRYAFKIRHKKG